MKSVVAKFIRPDGSPAAGAQITFLLSQDAISTTDNATVGHYPITAVLEADGTLPVIGSVEGMLLEACDELLPASTFYTVSVKDPTFGEIFHERLVISGTSPINLNLIAPAQR